MIKGVLAQYGIDADACRITAFGSGLINRTWKIECSGKEYILQCVNHQVFRKPADIDENIMLISNHLAKYHPGYLFISPVITTDGRTLVITEDQQYLRMFPFVSGSVSFDTAETAQTAFEAAAQFGRFTKLLSGLKENDLSVTLPDFHNLSLRQLQFENAVKNAAPAMLAGAESCIMELQHYKIIAEKYTSIRQNPSFRKRITHHDTKISNILFDQQGRGLCVIDLDTVMPGYFISDVGDMIRTYVCPVNEEEADLNRIQIRDEYFEAILTGYMKEMHEELTDEEINQFAYAGQFMIYMQAIRFMTDHLENDKYYGARYKGQNLVRAQNQATLLRRLNERMPLFEKMLEPYRRTMVFH